MHRYTAFVVVVAAAALLATSCQTAPTETAAMGSVPAVNVNIGPIPGVTEQPVSNNNPYAADKLAIADGRRLFVHYNCYGCHGGHAGGGMGPSLRDEQWIYGNSDARVFSSIAEGRANGMPAWGTRVPQDQIWRLVAYVKTLRTPLEADAPEQR